MDMGLERMGTDFSVTQKAPQRPANGRQPSAASVASEGSHDSSFSTANTERQTGSAELAGFPPKPPRSKLEPHRELIRELRRKGRTYREVARLFHERLGLHVASAPSTPS
jgi:hypothetical protein